MAVPRINIKSIDYFKFKKLVIDGVRDDYNSCSKEVKALCDCVQTLNFRDEEFDDILDRDRFEDVCSYYKQILTSKRIDPMDMRIKSGWWGDHKNAYSAGKLKPGILKETMVAKTMQWTQRHGGILSNISKTDLTAKVDGPGLYVLKHKEHQCFQYVGRADKIFSRFAEKLKAAFEGTLQEPLAALLVISMTTDWDFYFIPVEQNDDERVLRILENDLILKHDSIWPHGLNFRLHIDSILEVSEFRKSCIRHDWPPDSDSLQDEEINLNKLRKQISAHPPMEPEPEPQKEPAKPKPQRAKSAPKAAPRPITPVDVEPELEAIEDQMYEPPKEPAKPKSQRAKPTSKAAPRPITPVDVEPELEAIENQTYDMEEEEHEQERPSSATSTGTYVLSSSPTDDVDASDKVKPSGVPRPKSSSKQPRPTSAGKKTEKNSEVSSSKSTGRGTPGRDQPTTPRRGGKSAAGKKIPSRTQYSATERENDNPGSVSQDESEGSLDRSPSGNSLSSADGRLTSPEVPNSPRKSPVPKTSKARPTSAKSRQDKSRLPVAASGPLRHQNRD